MAGGELSCSGTRDLGHSLIPDPLGFIFGLTIDFSIIIIILNFLGGGGGGGSFVPPVAMKQLLIIIHCTDKTDEKEHTINWL